MNGPISRMKSPRPGCSTLTTSAPISPSSPAQNGAAMRVPRSRTRRPSSGPLTTPCVSELRLAKLKYASCVLAALLGADGVHAALLARLAGVERGSGVADELVEHEVVPPRLPLPLEVQHPVDRVLHGLRRDRRDQRDLVGHGAELLEVVAGREVLPLAGQHDHADLVVGVGAIEGGVELVDELGVLCVG